MIDYIAIGISFPILILYIIVFFLLIQIKRRVDGVVGDAIIYGIFAIMTLILLRTQTILSRADILTIPYSQEVLASILSIFIFMMVWTMYRGITEITDKKGRVKGGSRPRRKNTRNNFASRSQNISNKNSRISDGYIDLTK